jgi:FtsH-binding integral membrane protein
MEAAPAISAFECATRTFPLDDARAATLKTTYLLFGVSVLSAALGGYVGSQHEFFVQFFATFVGAIVALVLLNAIPAIALAFVESPGAGLVVLTADGFVSGIVISPLLWLARETDPRLIWAAFMLTAGVFGSVTMYVHSRRREFSAPAALRFGLFVSLAVAMLLNHYLEIGALGFLLSAGMMVFGIFVLVINTSRLLAHPEEVGAIPGALMLFAGAFNVFVGALNLLLRLLNSRR